MISIVEFMEKKTLLIKGNTKKKGMTLVEVMAAMAILSILFVGISGMISTIIKSETKSNELLDNSTIAKAVLSIFEVSGNEYITDEKFNELLDNDKIYKFDTISNLKEQILESKPNDGDKYTVELKVDMQGEESNLYKIKVAVYNNKSNDSHEKYIYVYRKL